MRQAELCSAQDAQVLISRTCKFVTSQGKMDLAHVIKVRVLTWEENPGLYGRA